MRELSKVCLVELESEYRTSKVHHGCRAANPGDLVNQYQRHECRDGVVRTCKVHCVLHCKLSNGGCGITVNRDVNASRNILRTFQLRLQGLPRPPEYCRQRLT
jgi:transposase